MKFNAAILMAGALLSNAALAADCADDSGPRKALESYITAMQAHKFNDAYNFVTANMTDGKSREDWAAQQKLFYEGGEVNILSMDIRKAQATGIVLSANDPVAAWGGVKLLRERFGVEPCVVTGPSTDNAVGVEIIEQQMKVPAFNAMTSGAELGDCVIKAIGLDQKFPLPAAAGQPKAVNG